MLQHMCWVTWGFVDARQINNFFAMQQLQANGKFPPAFVFLPERMASTPSSHPATTKMYRPANRHEKRNEWPGFAARPRQTETASIRSFRQATTMLAHQQNPIQPKRYAATQEVYPRGMSSKRYECIPRHIPKRYTCHPRGIYVLGIPLGYMSWTAFSEVHTSWVHVYLLGNTPRMNM